MIQIFTSTSDELSVILFNLRPNTVITLNIVEGLDEYLLIMLYISMKQMSKVCICLNLDLTSNQYCKITPTQGCKSTVTMINGSQTGTR